MIHRLLLLTIFLTPLTILNPLNSAYEVSKWLMAGFLLCFLFVTRGISSMSISWPKVPVQGWGIAATIVLIQVVGLLIWNPLAWADYVFYALCLSGFLFFFYQDIAEQGSSVLARYSLAMVSGASVVAILGLCQVLGFNAVSDLFGVITERGDVSSTFGNINYTGQYYGICILFGIFALNVLPKRSTRAFVLIGILLAVTHFSFINTRSVIVGGSLSLGFILWRGILITKRKFLKLLMASVTAIVIAHALVPGVSRDLARESRKKSSTIRLDMWRGTVDMIMDHPLGVGFNNFDFSFVSYRQKHQVDVSDDTSILNPHNEYLAIAAESGLPGALIIFMGFFYVVQRFFTQTRNHPKDQSGEQIISAIIIFLAVESFFQFPFEAAWPIILLALILAFCLSTIFPTIKLAPYRFRIGFLGLSALNLYLVASWFMAESAVKKSDEIAKAEFACEERPQDWFPCHRYAQALIKLKRFSEAEKVLHHEIEKQPNNWYALGLLGQMAKDQGRKEEVCSYYRIVDEWFNQKSRSHDYLVTNCGK